MNQQIVNKKGPRMKKGKYSKVVVTRKLFRKFRKENKEYKDMTWDEFFEYWNDIAETIRQETITNPLGVKLGSYLGELKYQYLPHKFTRNWRNDNETIQELGLGQRYTNIITKGKVCKVKWERRWAVKFNKILQYYAFEGVRELQLMAKDYTLAFPEKIRVSRNTLGGNNPWRKYNKK